MRAGCRSWRQKQQASRDNEEEEQEAHTKQYLKNAIGQADALEVQAWQAWLAHVENKGPTWFHVALTCSHLLGCRITEVLRLKAKDSDFEHKVVAISSLKGQAAITKTMSCAAFSTFYRFKDEGISVQRVRGCGCRGRTNECSGHETKLLQYRADCVCVCVCVVCVAVWQRRPASSRARSGEIARCHI